VRGGAIPLLAWALLLLVLFIGNWIWDAKAVNAAEAALAAILILAFAAFLVALSGRQALRKGPPGPAPDPEPVPEASLAAVIIGLAVACILFGVVWAHFLVFFGAGVLILSLGRLALELRSERETRWRSRSERQR
jgi:hypothetical protein